MSKLFLLSKLQGLLSYSLLQLPQTLCMQFFFHFPLNFTVHRRIHGNVREVYRETRTKESVIPIVNKPCIVFKASERNHLDTVAFQTLGYGNFEFIMLSQKYP